MGGRLSTRIAGVSPPKIQKNIIKNQQLEISTFIRDNGNAMVSLKRLTHREFESIEDGFTHTHTMTHKHTLGSPRSQFPEATLKRGSVADEPPSWGSSRSECIYTICSTCADKGNKNKRRSAEALPRGHWGATKASPMAPPREVPSRRVARPRGSIPVWSARRREHGERRRPGTEGERCHREASRKRQRCRAATRRGPSARSFSLFPSFPIPFHARSPGEHVTRHHPTRRTLVETLGPSTFARSARAHRIGDDLTAQRCLALHARHQEWPF